MASLDTTQDALEVERARISRARIGRRVFVVFVVLVMLAGVGGWFGLKTGKAQAEGNGTSIELTYARISRRGLKTPWELDVNRAGGFSGDVQVSISATYYDHLTVTRIDPEPTSTVVTEDNVVFTFQQPAGTVMRVLMDADVDASARPGRTHGVTTVAVNGEQGANVAYTTMVLP